MAEKSDREEIILGGWRKREAPIRENNKKKKEKKLKHADISGQRGRSTLSSIRSLRTA